MAQRLPVADIQFIADFAAFCRTKGDAVYCAAAPYHCALAQFGFLDVHRDDLGDVPLIAFNAAVFGDTGDGSGPFSALADRLEALIADAPAVVRQ